MNPRTVCRKQIDSLESLGFTILAAYECELMFLSPDDVTSPIFPDHVFVTTSSVAQYEDFLVDMTSQLRHAGIDAAMFQCEYAGGQIEVNLSPRSGMNAADMTFRFKQAVKEVVKRRGFARPTFMTKPTSHPICNGMHFNHSLWDLEGRSALYDAGREDKLSDVGRWWLAGLVKHAPALTALCSPTVNCYRR